MTGITAPLAASPFFSGSAAAASSELVPYKYPVSIDGRPYMIDTAMADRWGHETVPLMRPQSDDSVEPGEQSLNPDGLWRKSWSTWHKGAGQEHRDRLDSHPSRFRDSRGMDVWDRYHIKLLNAVDQKRTSSNTNLKMVAAGNRLFLMDGTSVVYTEDITVDSPTWTDCTNEPGGNLVDIASDGKYVWITDGSSSFWALASASPPAFNLAGWTGTQDVDVFDFVKGRLVGGHDNTLHTYDAAGVATAITIAGVIPDTFDFVGFAGGPSNAVIYAAGFAGDKSTIFRIGVKEDGTGLDVAIPAGELPDGEIVRSIGSYLGFVMLGTDEGVRFATPDQTGDLTIGALLETGTAVRCFEGQGPHVWFGWEDFTDFEGNDWHGLGRLSLEEFSSADRLAPAYATDLMGETDGQVSSVVTFQGRRVWTVEGTNFGVYGEQATPGASGYLRTGVTDFGFTGNKTVKNLGATYQNTDGTITFSINADESATFTEVEQITVTSSGTDIFDAGNERGARFEVLVEMTATGSTSPSVSSFHVESLPAVRATRRISIPLLLNEHLDPDGGISYMDVDEERTVLEGLWETRTPVPVQELGMSYTAVLEDFQWHPRMTADAVEGFRVDGTFVVMLKELI